jgi:hypothetical protein
VVYCLCFFIPSSKSCHVTYIHALFLRAVSRHPTSHLIATGSPDDGHSSSRPSDVGSWVAGFQFGNLAGKPGEEGTIPNKPGSTSSPYPPWPAETNPPLSTRIATASLTTLQWQALIFVYPQDSTVGRLASLHTIIALIPSRSLDPVLPCHHIPRVQQARQPPEKSEKYVETEMRTASPRDKDSGWWEEDRKYEQNDA